MRRPGNQQVPSSTRLLPNTQSLRLVISHQPLLLLSFQFCDRVFNLLNRTIDIFF